MKLYNTFCAALQPYQTHWEDWTISDYCFLTPNEIKLAEVFQHTQSLEALAKKTNRTYQTARLVINRIIRKLKSGKPIYEAWLVQYKQGKDQEQYPLHVPLVCLPISTRLKTSIYHIGETLFDVLVYSKGKLNNYRGFGKETQRELETFLASCDIQYEELIKTINENNPINNISPAGEYLQKNPSLIPCRIRKRAGPEALCVGREVPPAFASQQKGAIR